jgi:hypothetical protein
MMPSAPSSHTDHHPIQKSGIFREVVTYMNNILNALFRRKSMGSFDQCPLPGLIIVAESRAWIKALTDVDE